MTDLRAALVAACRRLDGLGFVAATDGNLSCRLGPDRLLVTPSGRSKGELEAGDLLVTDLEGRVVEGNGRPSSELPMHLFVYRRRDDVGAVVHAHPPAASGFAVAGIDLTEPVMPEIVLTVGPIPLARYATPSTADVPRSLEPLIDGHQAFLLESHGVLCVGRHLTEALHRMERVEHVARVDLVARLLGRPRALSEGEVLALFDAARALRGEREP